LNRVRLAVRAAHGDPSAIRLRDELAHQNRMLSTLLIGTNASSYLGSYAVAALLHGDGAGLTDWEVIGWEVVILTPLLFVFAETLPKDLFRTYTDRWSYALSAVPMVSRWPLMVTGLLPVVQGIGGLASRLLGGSREGPASARQRVSQLIKEGVEVGVISESQSTLVDRALATRDRTVGAEMVPWRRVATVPLDATQAARRTLMKRDNFTRLPVVDAGGRVVGVLDRLDALLDPKKSIRQLMQRPVTLAPSTRVRDALRTMRRERRPLAIVAERSAARPLGLVTLKDLVEPLTGELAAW
ncbi:MAG: CNNM domain-containing protein, partial [Gemmatimonadales bacterium]